MGGARLSGVHNCRQFLCRALAPDVMFPSPQWLKPAHFRILTAPLKRCSTLYTNSESALTICFLARPPFGLVPHYKLDRVHRLRADLLQGRKILSVEAVQLLLPGRVGNFDREHSIRVACGACLLRYLRSAHQRPGQQRRVVATLSTQGIGKDLLQCRAGRLHGVRDLIVEQLAGFSLFARRVNRCPTDRRIVPSSLSPRPRTLVRAEGPAFLSCPVETPA